MGDVPQWSPLGMSGNTGHCRVPAAGGSVAAMEPARDEREYPIQCTQYMLESGVAAMEPARDEREYRSLPPVNHDS